MGAAKAEEVFALAPALWEHFACRSPGAWPRRGPHLNAFSHGDAHPSAIPDARPLRLKEGVRQR